MYPSSISCTTLLQLAAKNPSFCALHCFKLSIVGYITKRVVRFSNYTITLTLQMSSATPLTTRVGPYPNDGDYTRDDGPHISCNRPNHLAARTQRRLYTVCVFKCTMPKKGNTRRRCARRLLPTLRVVDLSRLVAAASSTSHTVCV